VNPLRVDDTLNKGAGREKGEGKEKKSLFRQRKAGFRQTGSGYQGAGHIND